MERILHKYWAPIVATAIFCLTMVVVTLLSIERTDGRFIYDLDDAYIHMAVAKNFVQHGTWGVTKFEFSSSSSSVLWPLMLSLVYLICGVNESTPLLLNIAFSILLLWSVYWILRQFPVAQWYIFLVLLFLTFLTPLPALVLSGMEHVLQTLITILFIYSAARLIAEQKGHAGASDSKVLLWLAPFVTLVRYEGLFLIGAVCLLLTVRKRWLYSIALGLIATFPIVIYGFISVMHGWFALPNPVFLKGTVPLSLYEVMRRCIGYSAYGRILETPHILGIILVAVVLYVIRLRQGRGIWEIGQIMTAIFLLITFWHMEFASTGWFYRYEAYLVALGLLTLSIVSIEYWRALLNRKNLTCNFIPKHVFAVILAGFLIVPVAKRGLEALITLPGAMSWYYQVTYQMGLFLGEFYPGVLVALNDIGAPTYFADIKCFDLAGLGSLEIAQAKKNRTYRRSEVARLAELKGVRVAVLSAWFLRTRRHDIPSQWLKVGSWKIQRDTLIEDVWFYAVNHSEADSLRTNLQQFASKLPTNVQMVMDPEYDVSHSRRLSTKKSVQFVGP